MNIDEILAESGLPHVEIDVDAAQEATTTRARSTRRRRRAGLGLGAVLAVVVAVLVAGMMIGDPPTDLATGPSPAPSSSTAPATLGTAQPGDVATWVIDPARAPAETDSTLSVLVRRLGCNDGNTGTVLEPGIVVDNDRIVITLNVEPAAAGEHRCVAGPPVRADVDLGVSLGDRALVDGNCALPEAATTSFCAGTDGVRWQPPDPEAASTTTVRGTLQLTGGPGPSRTAAEGVVRVLQHTDAGNGPVVAVQSTDSDGRFELDLPSGTYDFYGNTPAFQNGQFDCEADNPITVTGSDLDQIEINCPMR